MVKREGKYQKRVAGEDRLLMIPIEHTTYAQMAAQQSQQQRTRNADALARARSVARLKYASLVANTAMLSNVADLTEVLCAMATDRHPVTADLVASISPYLREHIRRFGKFSLDMANLPKPLNPQPLPFEVAL